METAAELETAIQQIKQLSQQNTMLSQQNSALSQQNSKISRQNSDILEKVRSLELTQKELEIVNSKLKVLKFDYDQQIAANKKNKERIDELRRAKNDEEQKLRKTQDELQTQLEKLSDAEQYIQNLSRMASYTKTRYDFERSLLRLTNEQNAIVNQVHFNRDFLIKGSAGTGKSLVLLKALEKLLVQQSGELFEADRKKRIKLVCFTNSLQKYNRYVASLMSIGGTAITADEEIITTSEAYMGQILRAAFPKKSFTYSMKKLSLDEIENPLGNGIWTELEKFILPQRVTKKEYCEDMITRAGMKKAQNEANRTKIWAAVEKIFDSWEKEDEWYSLYGAYKLATSDYKVPDELSVDYLFVDEAQDLPSAKLWLLKRSTKNAMILAGDNDQSIFQPGFTWSRAGIDISGATRILNINFRSTNQINGVAEKYRALIKGSDNENRPETFRLGPPVELHESENEMQGLKQIVDTVRICIQSLNYESENICIIAPKNQQLEAINTLLKEELDLEGGFVSERSFDFAKKGIIRLATTQSCKGLDFPVVLFYIDHRAHFLDAFEEQTSDKINRNMIYTAITRGIELLHVFMPLTVSEGPIGDLKKILKSDS